MESILIKEFTFDTRFNPVKPKSGKDKFEFFTPEEAWIKFCSLYPEEEFAVEMKYDGMRMIIKIDVENEKVQILTEDKQRDRSEFFPNCIKEILKALKDKKIKNAIFDGEMVEYETEGKIVNNMQKMFNQLPREDLIPWITAEDKEIVERGKVVRVLDDSFVVFNLYDFLLLNDEPLVDLPYKERHKMLVNLLDWNKLIHWKPVETIYVKTKEEFEKAVDMVRRMKNSEGAMIKVASAPYEWRKGRTKYMAKIKNFKELDVIVLDKHLVKGTKNTYVLTCGVTVPDEYKDKIAKDFLVTINNQTYMIIGKTYNAKGQFKIGDIVEVRFIRIRRYYSKKKGEEDKYYLTWMFPQFIRKREDKNTPDDLTLALKIEQVGTSLLTEEDKMIESLTFCPYWYDARICLFRFKIALPPERIKEIREEALKLKYPVKCELAFFYKCPYIKDYYYETLQRSKYTSYPEKTSQRRYVVDNHWRARSLHGDLRFEMNDYLLGYTLLYQPKDTPEIRTLEEAREWWKKNRDKIKFLPEKAGQGIRVEEKAIQPKVWLTFEAVTPPGSVGATKENEGVIHIVDRGIYWEGWRTPDFQEWFLKSEVDNGIFRKDDYTRVIFRWVKVPKIDPRTKKPIKGQYEFMIRGMIPKDETPYIFSKRAYEKEVFPPKGVIPFPIEWTSKYFKEVVEWIRYMNDNELKELEMEYDKEDLKLLKRLGEQLLKCDLSEEDRQFIETWIDLKYPMKKWKEKPKGKLEILSKTVNYTLHLLKWKGQEVIRKMPKLHWLLRIDDKGKGQIRSFYLDDDPRFYSPIPCYSEGRVDRKWLNFEGSIPPLTEYNPNKRIPAEMSILSKGKAKYTSEIVDNKEVITLEIESGSLKGKVWKLIQEEEDSDNYRFFDVTSELLTKYDFKLDEHVIDDKKHWDIRINRGKYLLEINLPVNPIELGTEEWVTVNKKECSDMEWFNIFRDYTEMPVGDLITKVKTIDYGIVELLEENPVFMSFIFKGEKLNGYYVLRLSDKWEFTKSRLPTPEIRDESNAFESSLSNPLKGIPLKPFKEEKVPKSETNMILYLYDLRDFTRCEADWRRYLPDLKLKDGIVDLGICLYRVPDKIHHVRVAYVIYDKSKISREEVEEWIEENDLVSFTSPMIREKRD